MITVEDFLEAFPDYEALNLDDDQILALIKRANFYISQSTWGEEKAKAAIALIVAHFIETGWLQKIEVSGKATAVASGQAAGGVSSVNNDFTTTVYGRQYLELSKTVATLGMNF